MIADSTVVYNGVTVKKKIIPDETRWLDNNKAIAAGFKAGAYYKARVKMPKVNTVTVHNTEDLDNIEDDAERYVISTNNQNMGSVRPHFYTDDKSTWQILELNEVAWCNGRGTYNVGAIDDISIECVMGEDKASDKVAEDNAARIAAYCLFINKLEISALRTHQYWINLGLGVSGSVDYMNTYRHPKAPKYCPYYILPHWSAFKTKVQKYLDELNKPSAPITSEIYRVRKTATDAKTQIGAYSNLDSAKILAEMNRSYKVYNSSGKLVYSPTQYYEEYKIVTRAPIKFIPTRKAKTLAYFPVGKTVKVYCGTETTAENGTVWVKFTSPECAVFPNKFAWIPLKYLKKEG